MRIGLDVAQTCAERAGCAWVADALAKALVRSCPDDRFFLYHHFGAWLNHSTKQGTDLRGANVTSPLREFSRWQAHRLWSNVQKGTRSLPGQPEIVHAHSYQAPRVDPARLVFTVHDLSFWICPEYTTEPIRLMCQEGVLQALSRAAAFVFVSGSAKGDFERVLPGFVDRTNPLMHVVRLGSRYSPLAGRIQKESAAPWCFVGSVEPRKNLDALLEAMPLYWSGSRRRRKLVLAGGRGWNSQGLWKKISGLQNAGLVEHLGYVSDESLQALYQKSFALVFPSFYEGFGLPLVEAMSQSCPLICPNHSSLAEASGNAAFYVKDLTAASLAAAMLELESRPELWRSLTETGLALSRHFSWEKEARKLRALYEEVVRKGCV